jgi:GR25 family glycosyltransferase involved in LPS biosynthesis
MILYLLILVLLYITINKFNEFFENEIPVYLVSLEKDFERRINLLKYVTPNEYSSVDGSKLLPLDKLKQNNIIAKEGTEGIKAGEIGCYMSHYNILNKIKNYNHDYSIVIEDDVEFDINKNINIIKDIVNNAPSDWEIIFIGHNYYNETEEKKHHTFNEYTFKRISLVFGAQSYIVKNSAIPLKIQQLLPIKDPIDIIFPIIFTSYIIEPQLTKLSNFSGISNTQSIDF